MTQHTTSSFFDDHNNFNFIIPDPSHQYHLALQPLTKTQNTKCTNINNGTILKGTFKLQGNLLAYYSDADEMNPSGILHLMNARVHFSSTDVKHTLQITKNRVSFELSFRSENVLQYWMDCLKSVCVFSSVDDHFVTMSFYKEDFLPSVYLARNRKTSELFALKRFKKDKFQRQASAKAVLLNQIGMQRSLNHPNIVGLSQILETHGSIYFAKPYNPNHSLEFLLNKSKLFFSNFESQAAKIIKSILQGLDYLAYQGAMLQNLHMGNVIINKEGQVKVIDFVFLTKSDVVKLFDDNSSRPGYIAPEIFRENKSDYDEKSNIFSAGCILFEMLFGFPLFNAQNPANILDLNKSYNYSRVSDLINQEIRNPASLVNKQGLELLLRLLEPDYTKRISAREALRHPYFFQIEEKPFHENDFLLSLEKTRYEFEPSSSWSQSTSSQGSLVSTTSSRFPKKISTNPLESKRTNAFKLDSPQSILLRGARERSSTAKNVSFADHEDICRRSTGFSDDQNKNFEDNGELSEDDAQIEDCNVKTFLDSHYIQISIKNPGKF